MTSYLYLVKVDPGVFRLKVDKVIKTDVEVYKELIKTITSKTCIASFRCLYGVSAHTDLIKLFTEKYTVVKVDAFKGDDIDMCNVIINYMSNRNQKIKVSKKSKELVKETAKEPTKELVKEPTKETAKEPTKELVKELVKETAKEPTKELIKELVKEPTKELVKEQNKEQELINKTEQIKKLIEETERLKESIKLSSNISTKNILDLDLLN